MNINLQKILSIILILSLNISFASNQKSTLAVNKIKGVLSVMVLGSGGAIATSTGRASSGYLIFTDGNPRILMDVGGGTFSRIAESGVNLKNIDTILLTHLHVDHTADLSAVLKTIYLHNFAHKTTRSINDSPINFYGPSALPESTAFDATSTYINTFYHKNHGMERYLHGFVKAIGAGQFAYTMMDIPANHSINSKTAKIQTIIQTEDGLTVTALGVYHGSVPNLAYRIEYQGKSIVYSGDTTSKTDNMITISKNSDLLIYDIALTDTIPTQDSVFRNFHTTPSRIGQVANLAKVKKLLLSHLSPISEQHIDNVKKSIRENAYQGDIEIASDLAVYNID